MPHKGHDPGRTCLVCSSKRVKRALLRMAMDPETKIIFLDRHRHAKGRGAYVCPECLPQLRFNKRVQRSFRNEAKGLNLHSL